MITGREARATGSYHRGTSIIKNMFGEVMRSKSSKHMRAKHALEDKAVLK